MHEDKAGARMREQESKREREKERQIVTGHPRENRQEFAYESAPAVKWMTVADECKQIRRVCLHMCMD